MNARTLFAFAALATLTGAGCATQDTASLSAERRREFQDDWQLYQSNAPEWPAARDRWFAYGGAERETLILNLLASLVELGPKRVQRPEGGLIEAWRRPQRELLALDREAVVPILVTALRASRDPPSRDALVDTLGQFGAVDALKEALDHPLPDDSPQFRAAAIDALVRAGGAEATDRVGRVLLDADDWKERAAAADALGGARYADRDAAAAVLLRAVGDPDAFVLRRVLEALVRLRWIRGAPRVAQELEEANRKDREERREPCIRALRQLTGRTVPGDNPVLWQRAAADAAAAAGAEGG